MLTLKTVAELQNSLVDLDDCNTAYSALFYMIVQCNTLDYKNTSSDLVKRLVGSKLYCFVPMARYKKNGDTKAVYQYRRQGNNNMMSELDELGYDSIAAYLDVETNQPNDYYPMFVEKLQDAIEQRKEQAKAEKTAAKEAEKAEAAKEAEAVAKAAESCNRTLQQVQAAHDAVRALTNLYNEAVQCGINQAEAELIKEVIAKIAESNAF